MNEKIYIIKIPEMNECRINTVKIFISEALLKISKKYHLFLLNMETNFLNGFVILQLLELIISS